MQYQHERWIAYLHRNGVGRRVGYHFLLINFAISSDMYFARTWANYIIVSTKEKLIYARSSQSVRTCTTAWTHYLRYIPHAQEQRRSRRRCRDSGAVLFELWYWRRPAGMMHWRCRLYWERPPPSWASSTLSRALLASTKRWTAPTSSEMILSIVVQARTCVSPPTTHLTSKLTYTFWLEIMSFRMRFSP